MTEPEKSPVSAGDVIDGKYRVERVLGAGGMGVVVVATHLQLEQKVAIKFLLPDVAKNTEAVARFAREARAAAKIQSEHVVRVLDVASLAGGAPYMVMEYLEGQDLEATLQAHGELPIERVVDYLLQALEALAEAHVAGIVHRDLKPANIFLARRADGSSVVKVLDFGISKLSGDKRNITSTTAQMGSPLYMSPEQLRRTRDVDVRSDIWAIGVILHELLTGEAPFVGDSLAEVIAGIVTAPPLSTRLRRPDVPRELEAVVLRCLEKDPDARFPNVAELAVALSPFAQERSRVSVERIVRVVAGRKEISLPPVVPGERASRPVSTHMATRVAGTAVGLPARASRALDAAEEVAPKSAGTDPSWQTSGVLRSARRGRWIAIGAAVIAVLGLSAVATVLARRSPGDAAPLPAAAAAPPSLPTPPTPAFTTAEAPSAAPPPASAAPSETPAVAAPSVAPQRVATNRPTTTSASPPVTAPAPTPTPAPTKPGAADFGGRK